MNRQKFLNPSLIKTRKRWIICDCESSLGYRQGNLVMLVSRTYSIFNDGLYNVVPCTKCNGNGEFMEIYQPNCCPKCDLPSRQYSRTKKCPFCQTNHINKYQKQFGHFR